jgi:hypothetical protein
MTTLHFAAACLEGKASHSRLLSVTPTELVIAGWTGRNHAAIEHHIHELEALGVPRPSTVPLYYRVSHQQLTQDDTVQALGAESSGEAEPVLFFTQGEWWLTVGSDHTDRQVETYSVAVSKQMCAKPLARVAWRWADVVALQVVSRRPVVRHPTAGIPARWLLDPRRGQRGKLHVLRHFCGQTECTRCGHPSR